MNDLCPLKGYQFDNISHPKLGVVVMSSETSYDQLCQKCDVLPEGQSCQYHDKKDTLKLTPKPNYVMSAVEVKAQSDFEYKIYQNVSPNQEEAPNPEAHPYLPKHEMKENQSKTRFAQVARRLHVNWKSRLPRYFKCEACEENYTSKEKLSSHCLEAHGIQRSVRSIKDSDGTLQHPLLEFVQDLLQNACYDGSIFLTTPDVLKELYFIYRKIVKKPKIKDLKNLRFVEIQNVKFLDVNLFLGLNLPKTSWFPHFNYSKNFDQNTIPDLDMYFGLLDSIEDRENIKGFYESQDNNNWSFKSALKEHLHQTIKSILDYTLKVQNMCCEFQTSLQELTGKRKTIVSPYTYGSLNHCFYTLMQHYVLIPSQVKVVKHARTGATTGRISRVQYKYEKFIRKKFVASKIKSPFLHSKGAHKVARQIIDIFFEDPITIDGTPDISCLEVYGCKFHGCPFFLEGKCKVLQRNKRMTMAKNQDLMDITKEREKKLFEIFNLKTKGVQECQAREEMKLDEEFEKSFGVFPQNQMPYRLVPEHALIGGSLNVWKHYWSKEEHPDENMHFYDKVSFYPSILRSFLFPYKTYTITLEDDIEDLLYFDGQKYVFKSRKQGDPRANQEVFGLFQCDIIPPDPNSEDAKIPFLAYRTPDKRILYPLCGLCSHQMNEQECSHTEQQRMFTGCYTIQEISHARRRGYKIPRIRESLTFDSSPTEKIFYPFMQCLSRIYFKYKMKSDDEDAVAFCRELNEHMDFTKDGLEIHPSDLIGDTFMKSLMKLLMNSIIGRLAKRQTDFKTVIVKTEQELDKYFDSGSIIGITPLNDEDNALAVHLANDEIRRDCPYTNIILAAYVYRYFV